MGPHDVSPPSNIEYAYEWLTGDGLHNYTAGKLGPMSAASASALLGNWVVETGDPTLTNLDVVEKSGGAGRGISQYTAARRISYDRWRRELVAQGGNPNSIDNQLKYFADEYLGKHDPGRGKSLIGYTNSLHELDGMNATAATIHLQRDYFRPSTPHLAKRVYYATKIYNKYS